MDLITYIILWIGVFWLLFIWLPKRIDKEETEKAEQWEKKMQEIHEQRRIEDEKTVKRLEEQRQRLKAESEETERQGTSDISTHSSSSFFSPSINYSSQSSNMVHNSLYPVKRYETVEEIYKRCDEYWERHLGMPISSITNTPDYSAFGIAANTPGVDLAEAQMFDNLDLF